MEKEINKFKEAVKEAKEIGKVDETKSTKKVLKIKNGVHTEFLFACDGRSVATCKSIQDALDISDWDFNQISFIISNLKKVGYKVEVKEVKIND